MFLNDARSQSLDMAEHRYRCGMWTQDQWEAFSIAWQVGAPRFGVFHTNCEPFNAHVADLALELLATSPYWLNHSSLEV